MDSTRHFLEYDLISDNRELGCFPYICNSSFCFAFYWHRFSLKDLCSVSYLFIRFFIHSMVGRQSEMHFLFGKLAVQDLFPWYFTYSVVVFHIIAVLRGYNFPEDICVQCNLYCYEGSYNNKYPIFATWRTGRIRRSNSGLVSVANNHTSWSRFFQCPLWYARAYVCGLYVSMSTFPWLCNRFMSSA
jgi:hypothetical protein